MASSSEMLYAVVPSDTSVGRTVVGAKDTFPDWEMTMAVYQKIIQEKHCKGYKAMVNRYIYECAWHLVVEGEKFGHDAEKYRKILAHDIIHT